MPSRAGPLSLARQLGTRIRALRGEANLTQERLAWDCDLDKGYLSQVEAGKRIPSVPVLAMLAKRLGIELADLFVLRLTRPRLALLDAARRGDREGVQAALRRLELAESPERPAPRAPPPKTRASGRAR
jgi:transcriptional regulator with XRE-family HTH domain